jgi:hypothetical protein
MSGFGFIFSHDGAAWPDPTAHGTSMPSFMPVGTGTVKA